MNANQLRAAFRDFFVDRGHTSVPSASLIPHDPTVLFTIAGMVPFKTYFTGEEAAPWPRATSAQKCFRTVDIDIIGTTRRHNTFFEMLGNFSFGDYFKSDAIGFHWDLFTEVLGIDPDLLWISVYDDDDEAIEIWAEEVGVRRERIQRMGADNFWSMGETGPCGPSSELYFDKGETYGADGGPLHGGEERYVELANLVFMQFDRQSDGSLVELPKKNIDTGSGLERVLGVLTGKDSSFDTDALAPLVEAACSLTGRTYGRDEHDDIQLRILADHGRAMTMVTADGVLPSNEGRGYVLRRLIRRTVLAARRLGVENSVTPSLIATAIEIMGSAYPELHEHRDLIEGVIEREEEGFERTLENGLAILGTELDATAGTDTPTLSGATAFRLHDTYGFPLELTKELAAERSVAVDIEGFNAAMAQQRQRARDAARTVVNADEKAYRELAESSGPTTFLGRSPEYYALSAKILGVFQGAEEGTVEIFLDQTPFYAEGGGQVGDTGSIVTETGRATVLDTVAAIPGLFAHRAKVEGEIFAGQDALAAIDVERREAIRRNHTATHLLHSALRSVLGDHVRQQSSMVAPDRLRFDFSHHGPVTPEELTEVLAIANGDVLSDAPVETVEASKDEAMKMGALAFFGDKYGEKVRVVRAGAHSLEFCGGTHVGALGMIGPITIVTESSIGSGTRRIEALTGTGSLALATAHTATLEQAAQMLRTDPDDVIGALERLLERQRGLDKELQQLRQGATDQLAAELAAGAANGTVVARVDGRTGDELRTLAQAISQRGRGPVVLVGTPDGSKVALCVVTSGDPNATELAKSVATVVGGGAGGSDTMSVAGGRDVAKIDEALEMARRALGSA